METTIVYWGCIGFIEFYWVVLGYLGVPKIRGTILGVPMIRTIVFWSLYWGPPIWGNYHILFTSGVQRFGFLGCQLRVLCDVLVGTAGADCFPTSCAHLNLPLRTATTTTFSTDGSNQAEAPEECQQHCHHLIPAEQFKQ